jgi:hypothetical protein
VQRTISFTLLIATLLLVPSWLSAQSRDDAVDLSRIPQKAVRNLIRREHVKTTSDFQNITTGCFQPEDSLSYRTNLKTIEVPEQIDKVWEKYMTLSPAKAWNSRTVRFGFLFSKPENKFIYAGNADEPMGVGNIIYVNLRLLRGLKNLGVGFEVTRLDKDNKTICFCYLKDGVSNGTQEIRFSEIPGGRTRISHLTHYKSHSAFRDKELYPIFHEKFVGEFHENVLRQIGKGL